MKKYWLCKYGLFMDIDAGKIYLETENGMIDNHGMVRSAVNPSTAFDDVFKWREYFEEVSFNKYLTLIK